MNDLYTKLVLSMIAACLVVLCFEQSHWAKLETVQAQQPFQIEGYNFDGKFYRLGSGLNDRPGIPVVVVKMPGSR